MVEYLCREESRFSLKGSGVFEATIEEGESSGLGYSEDGVEVVLD